MKDVNALCGLLCVACSSTPGAVASGRGQPVASVTARGGTGGGTAGSAAPGSYGNANGTPAPRPSMMPMTGGDGGAACAADTQSAKSIPVDVFIMLDQSLSMIAPVGTGTRWSAITTALQTFVQQPQAAGLGVGIQYFGLGLAGVSCNAPDYATAEVEIAPLPDNAQPIEDSIAAHIPSSVTPTGPALQGAIMHASQWQMAHPDHVVVVVLATDGEPDSCFDVDPAQVAAAGLAGMPSIRTYVIGVGSGLTALDEVAMAGGTDQAFIVDDGTDTTQKFVDALDKIRQKATLPCQYALPAPTGTTQLDFDKVNFNLTLSKGAQAGQSTPVLRAPDPNKCDAVSGGWYYDDPAAPKSIQLCPATCSAVGMDPTGKVEILVGCPTRIIMVQ